MLRKKLIMLVCFFGIASVHSVAFSQSDAEILIDKASTVVSSFATDPDLEWFRETVK